VVGLKLVPSGREGDCSVLRTKDHVEQIEVMGKQRGLGSKKR
jgi:hypothetical protein